MAKTNLYLKDPSSKKETLIYLYYAYSGNRLKYSTGEKVEPKYWNADAQQVKKSYVGSPELNFYLNKVKEEVNSIYRTALTNGDTPYPSFIREELSKKLRVAEKVSSTFMGCFEEFIEVRKAIMSKATIQKYKTLRNHLEEFKKTKKTTLNFENVDFKFYEKLIDWYFSDKGLLNNSTGKYIATLKTFLHWATEREYNSNTTFKKFKVPKSDVDIIYLTENELMGLYNHPLPKRLEYVRDVFCFGCFTGLRFSDISNLKKENIKDDHIILSVKKTKEKLVIPLNDFSKEVLDKYDNKLPTISNQKTNTYLKEVGASAGIDTETIITKYRGAERIEITEPKYKFITTHTARRTFVTLSLEKGMRAEAVMSITGHKDYKSFKKYIKITDKVKVVEMQRIWNKKLELKAV